MRDSRVGRGWPTSDHKGQKLSYFRWEQSRQQNVTREEGSGTCGIEMQCQCAVLQVRHCVGYHQMLSMPACCTSMAIVVCMHAILLCTRQAYSSACNVAFVFVVLIVDYQCLFSVASGTGGCGKRHACQRCVQHVGCQYAVLARAMAYESRQHIHVCMHSSLELLWGCTAAPCNWFEANLQVAIL